MANRTPRGSEKSFTDAQLRSDLKANLSVATIAKKHHVSRQAVYKRVNQLGLTTVAATVAPVESTRFVRNQLSAQEQLLKGLDKVNLLMDACDEWLRDASDPDRYEIGPRSGEVNVTYEVEIRTDKGFRYEKRKKPLSEILKWVEEVNGERVCGFEKWESRHADPRDTVLKTVQEARSTVTAAADLARMLADAKAMETFRNSMLDEIRKVSPEVANAIADAVRRSIVLQGALEGLNALPSAPD